MWSPSRTQIHSPFVPFHIFLSNSLTRQSYLFYLIRKMIKKERKERKEKKRKEKKLTTFSSCCMSSSTKELTGVTSRSDIN